VAGNKAQMPFSIVAVLLLVLSSASIALIYGSDMQKERARIPQETLEDMMRVMDEGCEDVARLAYSAAADTVLSVRSLNSTVVQEKFMSALASSLESTFSSDDGIMSVKVLPNLSLVYLNGNMIDPLIQRSHDLSSSKISSIPAYAAVVGNFTIEVHCPLGMLTKTTELEKDVYIPMPLLTYRLGQMSASLDSRGELENIVRYELAALAQDRVLRGYGSYAKTGPMSTEAILTAEDVVRAVEMALLLQELRYFHDLPSSAGPAWEAVDDMVLGQEGYLDPADLFLRSYGEDGIDLTALVAQSLYARADAIVLRWMEYLGFLELADKAEDLCKGIEGGLWSVVDLVTGGDRDQASMIGYISQAMTDAGFAEENYRWHNYGGGDIIVTLPSYRICLYDDAGQAVCPYFQGSYAVDLPSIDLFASEEWGELFDTYRSETHILAEGMKGYIQAIAQGIASHCSLPLMHLELDPEDDLSYVQEIDRQLQDAFTDRSSWLDPALQEIEEIGKVRDGLAQAVIDFTGNHWIELMQVNRSVYAAVQELSVTLAAQLEGRPGFSSASIAEPGDTILMSLRGDGGGAREVIMKGALAGPDPILDMLNRALSQRYAEVDPDVGFLASGLTILPGVGALTSLSVMETVEGMANGLAAQGGGLRLPLSSGGLMLTLADGQQRTENIAVDRSALRSASVGQAGSLDVDITLPWDFERNSTYPNRHVTEVMNMTSSPYLTQWSIAYEGQLDIMIRSGSADAPSTSCSAIISLCSSFNIVAFSGWGLKGVSYEPTATLIGDIQGFLLKAWDFLEEAVLAVGGTIGNAFQLFNWFVEGLLSFSTQGLEALNDLFTEIIDRMTAAVEGYLESMVGLVAESFLTIWGGTVIDLTVLGLDLSVQIAPQDSVLAGVKDLMRVDIEQSLMGVTLVSSLRVLRLATGEHALAAAVSLGEDDWKVGITVDPSCKVFSHEVEVRGYLGGSVLEVFFPEVERSEKISLALSDIPGVSQLLRCIPSPLPGTKFHIDARMELSFNVPHRPEVMINEVELNPRGTDRSREWVELINPTDEAVDLNGWALVSSRGQAHVEKLSGTLEAHGIWVHQFTGQALDNGDVEGFPLQETLALLDEQGNRVDSAPWLQDLKDDERTWQRTYDGSSSWEMREGSKGVSNGKVLSADADLAEVTALMVDCFQRSAQKVIGSSMDVTTLRDVIADALYCLEDRLLDSVEQAVSSLRFSLELGLDDVTGSLGGGLFAALVYDGKAIRDCLEWFVDTIGEVVRDPLNPQVAGSRAPVPIATLAEHVLIEAGAYLQVSAPDLVEDLVGIKITAKAVIRVALGNVVHIGQDPGSAVHFGLVAGGFPGASIRTPIGLAAVDSYDVWLLKGVLRTE